MDPILSKYLTKFYYDIDEPTSFQSANVLYRRLKSRFRRFKLSDVKNWLQREIPDLVHKPLKKKFPKNPIVSKTVDHIWNIDLVEIIESAQNRNFRFILTVIDNLSKYAWIRLLKNKKAQTVLKAFRDIISKSKRKPQILGSDSGSEFVNKLFRKFLIENNIKIYYMRTPFKAVLIERFNRTLKERIRKYAYHHKTNRFVDVIDKIVENYNKSIHSGTRMRPIDVKSHSERQAFRNLYRQQYKPLEAQKYQVGDRVFIPTSVGSDPTKVRSRRILNTKYKPEIYIIERVYHTSPRKKYVLRSHKTGKILPNSFYSDQLIKTGFSENGTE